MQTIESSHQKESLRPDLSSCNTGTRPDMSDFTSTDRLKKKLDFTSRTEQA